MRVGFRLINSIISSFSLESWKRYMVHRLDLLGPLLLCLRFCIDFLFLFLQWELHLYCVHA